MLSVSGFLSSDSQFVTAAGARASRNRLLLSVIAAASLLLGGASASATSTTVAGVTPGAIAVDESGSANYSIPISVPPGVAGMAPSLSLIYGSRGDNGILGVGWSLGGLSVIHRCGRTIEQDGAPGGVDYSADDRFCLDGQRLVATEGTYGADGTVYSTELASFSKIVSYGTAGAGPAYFKVWTKSGQVMTYGNTADSAVEVPGQADVRYWSVNRIEDRVGNYLDLVYAEDTTAASTTENTHKITRINYAGNTVAGTLPTASVRFVYEARTDTRVHFMSGAKTQTLERLKSIETYATFGAVDTLVKRYDMAYEYGLATGRSRLTSLTECDANDNCLMPHEFTYNGNPTSYVWSSQPSRAAPVVFADKNVNVIFGNLSDVNGDGQIDLVTGTRRNSGTVSTSTFVSTATGWANTPSLKLPGAGIIRDYKNGRNEVWGELVDINGDGLTDWVRAHRTTGGVVYKTSYLNTGSGWVYTPAYNLPNPIENYKAKVRHGDFVDVNGDGLVDWVQAFRYNGANTQATYLNTGSGWQYTPGYNLPGVISSSIFPGARYGEFVDVNGDGLPDWVLAYRHNGANQIATYLNTGSGWQLDTAYNLPTVYYRLSPALRTGQFIDINGDGLRDFAQAYRFSNGTYYLHTWLSTGKGWEYSAGYNLPSPLENAVYERTDAQFADLNSDGLPDFVVSFRGSTGGVAKISYLNTGSGWKLDPNFEGPSVLYDKKRNVYQSQLGDVDGDGLVDWIRATRSTSGVYTINTWVNSVGATDLLISAKDGLGRMAEITYKPLTDDSVYTKGSGAAFPEVDIEAPMYVVSSVTQDDGKTETPGNLEGQAVINYTYAGAKVNAHGRGFLGFRTVTARDEQTEILTTTTYNQTYPFTGQVDSSVTRLDSGAVVDLVKQVDSTYASLTIFDGTATNQPSVLFPYADSSTSKAYEITDSNNAGFLVSTTTTSSTYDSYGNATDITQTVTDETTGATAGQVFSTQTASVYTNDEVNWILGRVTSTTVTKSRPGAPDQSRKSAWEYNAANGLLTKEIIEPDIPALKVTTSYTYDSFGNETGATVDGAGITARGSTTTFDAIGQFPISSANALSHSESMVTDARFGVVTSLTGPNAITTTWEYDGFGRKTKELRADGTESRISYELCDAVCEPGSVYKITTQDFATGGAAINTPSIQYYDKMNRVFRTESIAFDGVTRIYVNTSYNPRGESHMVSRPYFEGTLPADIKWATTHYDQLGRRMSVIAPDGGIQEFDFGGLVTQTTNALFQTESKTQNAIGELVLSEGHSDVATPVNRVSYKYDAYGNLLETAVEDPANSVTVTTTMSYDQRGRKTGMVDPDMGAWSYSYNVLGELISQTDAKLQTVTMTYDLLGRMATRIEAEGTTTWIYDNATKGIGKIHQVSGPNGYLEVASYDSLGRPDTTTTTISATVYTTSLTYDALGRPSTITYPSGFAVQNNYTANGFLGSVSEILGGTVYWQANSVDAEGMVTQETLGNGVVTDRAYDPATSLLDSIQTNSGGTSIQNLTFNFDTLGNLKDRTDVTRDRKEAFTYDGLNRLLSSTLTDTSSATTLNTTTYAYDALGNITNKSDVGAYLYGQNGAGPHAVTTAGVNTYTYDANGSMISGAGRTTSWTSFNKPQSISDSLTGNQTSFVYGPSRARIQQTAVNVGQATTTTTYIGGSYERRSRLNQPDELVHYIRSGGGTVAIYTRIDDGQALTDKTRYLHKDHLGSVESITDEQGVVTEHLSYDAHGKRRQSDWNAGTPAAPSETPRGFTGHEHLDGVGLIHMNGRVYDPTLGRFLSADPNVQAPSDTQSFNRYSYVKNNPLSYNDPSGFFFKKLFKSIVKAVKKGFKAVVSFFKKALQNEIVQIVGSIAATIVGGPLASVAFSGLVTLANGGDLGQALLSAAIAFAVSQASLMINSIPGLKELTVGAVAIKALAHGVIGGVASVARGGEFKSGFLASSFGSLAGSAAAGLELKGAPAIAFASVSGGVGAELGGGKFKNGAVSGAFSALAAEVARSNSTKNISNSGGRPDIATEGTAEERQNRFDEAVKELGVDDVEFVDRYLLQTEDANGRIVSRTIKNTFTEALSVFSSAPKGHNVFWVHGFHNSSTFLGLRVSSEIIVFRSGVMGWTGTREISGNLLGPWSPRDNIAKVLGHELGHRRGYDEPHSRADEYGLQLCKSIGRCGAF